MEKTDEKRIKEWIKANRYLKGKTFIKALNRRLHGYYNYYNVPGNLSALLRFYSWAEECAFKLLKRREEKRKSFTLKTVTKAMELLGIAKLNM